MVYRLQASTNQLMCVYVVNTQNVVALLMDIFSLVCAIQPIHRVNPESAEALHAFLSSRHTPAKPAIPASCG
jgi:hypothetical protein